MKASPLFGNFSAGEWGALLEGRPDLDDYRNAMKLCENGVPLAQGPWTKRPGTRHIAATKYSAGSAPRIVPVEIAGVAYVLEIGQLYVRVYKDREQLYSGSFAYEVVTLYLGGHVRELSIIPTPSQDALYIFHADYPPAKLTRTGHTAWTLTAIDFKDGPYLPINLTTTTLTPSTTAPGVGTITASSTAGINGGLGFASHLDYGRFIRIQNGTPARWGVAKVLFVTSSTQVIVEIVSTFGATTPSEDWRLAVWTSTTDFPACGTFHEDRLVLANWRGFSQRIDASAPGDYTNFSPSDPDGTVTAGHAYAFTINSQDAQAIRWVVSGEKGLYVGTQSSEWIVRASTRERALSSTNVNAKQSTNYGSAAVQPVEAGGSVLFVQKSGRKLRDMRYSYESDGFKADDRTLLNTSITKSGLVQLAYQHTPHSILWAIRTDGKLVGLTYDPDVGVIGWHRHKLGGYSDADHAEDAVVESIAVIPEPEGTHDELWLVVRRNINGTDYRCIEYMTAFREEGDAQEDAFYVDCGVTYAGSATSTVAGLDHLEGETVAVLADGAVHPPCVVDASGTITLQNAASKVHVGLLYKAKGMKMRPEAGAADGTAQGKTKRWNRVVVRLSESAGLKVGADAARAVAMSDATTLSTGDQEIPWEPGYDQDGYIYWEQEQPLPVTILGFMGQLLTQDR